ncbi:hypothetical protein Tco_0129716, partial [Tanacetum coccineum]
NTPRILIPLRPILGVLQTELATTVRHENEEDRPYHRYTAMILDREAMYDRIAWTSSEDRSAVIEAHVRTLEAQFATLIAQTS